MGYELSGDHIYHSITNIPSVFLLPRFRWVTVSQYRIQNFCRSLHPSAKTFAFAPNEFRALREYRAKLEDYKLAMVDETAAPWGMEEWDRVY